MFLLCHIGGFVVTGKASDVIMGRSTDWIVCLEERRGRLTLRRVCSHAAVSATWS